MIHHRLRATASLLALAAAHLCKARLKPELQPQGLGMKIVSLLCNQCGAPLDVRSGTRFATCQFCEAKLAIHEEGNAAFSEVLEQINERTGKIENMLADLGRQNEIERIDREWEQEREGYYRHDKHGQKHLPSKVGSLIAAIMMTGFGVAWTTMASLIFWPFALFGVLFIGLAIASGIWGFAKATQYESGRREYERRRRSALTGDFDADF